MATIKNSIGLQDRMTPVFRSIIKSMESTMKVMARLDKQANNGQMSKAYKTAEKDISRANNALIKMQNHIGLANKAAGNLAQTSGSVSRSMAGWKTGSFNLVNFSAALYLLKNIKSTIDGIMSAPDTARSTIARLGLFNESKYSNEQLYGAVYKTALETRTGLEDTGNLATRLLISGAMKGPGAATGAIKTTGIINKALVAGGGTAEENRRSLVQLSQALASGNLQGDELRSIREQTPYLMKIMAEGLGKVDDKFKGISMGSLKQLGADGELTSERLIKAFLAMETEVNGAFGKMPKTFGQAMTQLTSIWQYFLYQLSTGQGALGKITEKVWQLADYLASAQGQQVLAEIALGITMVVELTLWAVKLIIDGMNWLRDHTDVLKAALMGLAVVMIIMAVSAMAAWIAATWPILLVFAIVTGLVFLFLKLGFTIEQIVGAIFGAVTWLAGLFVNIGLWLGNLGVAIWVIIQNIGTWFVNMVMGIGAVWNALVNNIQAAFTNAFITVETTFGSFVSTVLQGVKDIIDWLNKIPGVNIGTEGIVSAINTTAATNAYLESKRMGYQDIGDAWTNSQTGYKSVGEGFNTFDAFPKGWSADWYGKGYKVGEDLASKVTGYDFASTIKGVTGIEDILNGWDPNSMTMDGGKLDSVGKIDSDVDISSEDLKLLRDMAAREFLLNLNAVTPQAKITFGDVRETADVNKIMEVIENMVENAFATSLVED